MQPIFRILRIIFNKHLRLQLVTGTPPMLRTRSCGMHILLTPGTFVLNGNHFMVPVPSVVIRENGHSVDLVDIFGFRFNGRLPLLAVSLTPL